MARIRTLGSDESLGPKINRVRLKAALEECNITQERFAKAAGFEPILINQFLSGAVVMGLRARYRLACAIQLLGLDPNGEIISGNDGFFDYTIEPQSNTAKKIIAG